MKRCIRHLGLSLSCLTVATVALAQHGACTRLCGLAQPAAVFAERPVVVAKARLSRAVEPRRIVAAGLVAMIAPPV